MIVGPNATEHCKNAWNDRMNVRSVRQPVETGFSYADPDEQVMRLHKDSTFKWGGLSRSEQSQSTTAKVAEDIFAFIAIFFAHFSKLRGRSFHMAGEAYSVGPYFFDFKA